MRRLLLAACLGLMALAPAAHAWPDRPVTIIAPFGPGTSVDIAARLLAPKLQAAWGQPVVVTNVPGSAGIIGVERAVRATDGHTILLSADAAIVVRVSMAPRPPYDPRRDLLPVSLLGRTTNILVVSNSFPARNLAELVAIARARPGSVAYNDAASQIQDVLTGRVTMSFQSGVVALPRLRDNAWRALAVSAPARMAALPDLPTVAEQGYPGFDAVAWLGVLAPASMPAANVARIHRDVVAALAEPELRGRLAELGVDVVGSTPEEFRALIEREIPRMAGVLGRAGIRPD